jgi:hypothetical protein
VIFRTISRKNGNSTTRFALSPPVEVHGIPRERQYCHASVGLGPVAAFKDDRGMREGVMSVRNVDGLMRAMELEGNARIDIIRIGKDIQTAGYARRSPSVEQYEELRRAVVQWQRIADDIGRIIGSG